MGLIAVPKRQRIFKPVGMPQIDRDDFLVRGLLACLGMMPYEFGGKVIHDISGRENAGTLVGTAPSWTPGGKFGPAVLFPGTDECIDIDTVVNNLAGTTTGTWSIWVKPVDATPDPSQTIMGFGDTDAGEYINLNIGWDGKCYAELKDAGSNIWILRTDNVVFSDNTWTKIDVIHNGVEPIIFIDSIAVPQTFITDFGKVRWFSHTVEIDNGRIGCQNADNNGNINFFNGVLDIPLIFDRDLNISEITLLFQDQLRFIISPRKRAMWLLKPVVGGEDYFRTIDDNVGIADAMTRTQNLTRIITDGVGTVDSMGRTQAQTRTFAEALGITDAITRQANFPRTIADDVGMTDAVTKTATHARIVSDAMGVTDAVTRTQVQLRTIADALGLTDTVTKSQGHIRTIADDLGITDDLTRICAYVFTQADDVGIADAMIRVAIAVRTISDDVGMTDTISIAELVKAAWAFMIIRQTHN